MYESPLELGSPDPVGVGPGNQTGLERTRTKKKKNTSSVSGREATSFPDLRVGPALRAQGMHNQM